MREWRYLSTQPQGGRRKTALTKGPRRPDNVRVEGGQNSGERTRELRERKIQEALPQQRGMVSASRKLNSDSRSLKDIEPKRGTRLHRL